MCGEEQIRPAEPHHVHVYIIEDEYGTREAASQGGTNDEGYAVDANGERYCMTDGAGLISHNLAKLIPSISSGDVRKREARLM